LLRFDKIISVVIGNLKIDMFVYADKTIFDKAKKIGEKCVAKSPQLRDDIIKLIRDESEKDPIELTYNELVSEKQKLMYRYCNRFTCAECPISMGKDKDCPINYIDDNIKKTPVFTDAQLMRSSRF